MHSMESLLGVWVSIICFFDVYRKGFCDFLAPIAVTSFFFFL